MYPSIAEEVVVLSLDDGRSCTWKHQRRRELHTKARPSDPSVDGGSFGLVSWRWWRRQRRRRLRMNEHPSDASLKRVAWLRLEVLRPRLALPCLTRVPRSFKMGGTSLRQQLHNLQEDLGVSHVTTYQTQGIDLNLELQTFSMYGSNKIP
ncbi:hypothetical protein MUK42_30279 [Musa troglodytarum]|uniref:Uncharacterized protein n=1 Tax=Musa troglodytarum TaxID=320322 RepID=A0A9E7FAT6_9LILI|nr:hypothetical protein MUK42_30279 [Musa troglodytarum]